MVQPADIPPPQSAILGLNPVARELLLISRPAEGRRLSWPEHTVERPHASLAELPDDTVVQMQLSLPASRDPVLNAYITRRFVFIRNLKVFTLE